MRQTTIRETRKSVKTIPQMPEAITKKTKKRPKPLKDFETEHVSPNELTPHPKNYRTHPDDQLEHLIASIREHGFYRNIVVAKDGTILAGHGVVTAAKKMRRKTVPVIRLPITADDPRAIKVMIGDNEIEHLAEQDDRLLTNLLRELREADEDELKGTGFDEMMLANLVMVTRSASEIEDFNAAVHWVGLPDYEPKEDQIEIAIRFRNEEDRSRFISNNKLKIQKLKNKVSCWWPEREREDIRSLRYEQDNKT